MIKDFFVLFYTFNKWAMNIYWIIYIKFLLNGEASVFGHLMGVICFMYFISNIIYFIPTKN